MSTHKCNGCTNDWSPGNKCHATCCGRNFSNIKNFDKHRVNGECVDPSSVGLVLNSRSLWTLPGEVDFFDRLQEAKANA